MRRRLRFPAYVAAVVGVGLSLLGLLLVTLKDHTFVRPGAALTLSAILVVGELRPIKMSSGDDALDEVTISCSFSLALTLLGPVVVAVGAQALAVACDDMRQRKPIIRTLFNLSQYVITLLATRLVYAVLADRHILADARPFGVRDILPSLAAAVTFLIINHLLTTTVVALSADLPIRDRLRAELSYHLSTSGVLLLLAPAVLQAAEFSPLLVSLLLLPIAAVHKSASLAIERERQALHDPLTGLPNREMLRQRARRALTENSSHGGHVAVLLADLDHFKEINDTLGHHVGDELIERVAARLASSVRPGDLVARLGGDEFAVLAHGLDRIETEALAARLTASLDQPFELRGMRVDTGASVGIALAPEHGKDIETLLQRADIALYEAKEHRGTVATYSPEADEHTLERLTILGELREAVPRGEVILYYQPKCDAHSGELVGFEALARWQHPQRGLLGADAFIPLAEHSGLLGTLTRVIFEQALTQCRRWWDEGRQLTVAVNVSPRYLGDVDLPSYVAAMLDQHRLPPQALTVEVTESTLLTGGSRAAGVVAELGRLGVRVAIDDFGSGYSSLAYLSSLAVDELKIDKSFVLAMAEANNEVIVRSTIELGHNLGLTVVAEGVESHDRWRQLVGMGCDFVQGYLLSRPMTADASESWSPHLGAGAATVPSQSR